MRLLVALWSLTAAAAYQLPTLPRRSCVSMRALDSEADVEAACILLPYTPFPGTCPSLVGGEMQLQELEDDTDTVTQIFMDPDGTVTIGATDGPPPVDICGLWQCGSEQFQMTLQRTYSSDPSMMRRDMRGRMDSPLEYTVTRVYVGSVDAESSGVKIVDGKIGFFALDNMQTLDVYQASDEQGIFGSTGASAVGFFNLDGNASLELETRDPEARS